MLSDDPSLLQPTVEPKNSLFDARSSIGHKMLAREPASVSPRVTFSFESIQSPYFVLSSLSICLSGEAC